VMLSRPVGHTRARGSGSLVGPCLVWRLGVAGLHLRRDSRLIIGRWPGGPSPGEQPTPGTGPGVGVGSVATVYRTLAGTATQEHGGNGLQEDADVLEERPPADVRHIHANPIREADG